MGLLEFICGTRKKLVLRKDAKSRVVNSDKCESSTVDGLIKYKDDYYMHFDKNIYDYVSTLKEKR